jgi:hypothetical protein
VRGKAEVLQIGTDDAAHRRVSVQAGPGPSLEVSEIQLLLQLLVRLLAHPAAFDDRGQGP